MRRLLNRIEGFDGETGVTIVEVVVAAVVLAMGAMATFGILGAATKNAQRAKSSQVALDLAQEEIERLRSIPYDDLAVTRLPAASTNPSNPNFRVQGLNFALKRSPVGEPAPLIVDEETGFSPESEFFSGNPNAGGVTGTVYRYVVWRNDSACPDSQCEGEQDYKQIVVAVQPSAFSGQQERGYVEVQSGRIDPAALNEPPPDGGEEPPPGGGGGSGVTAQQFYLSDSPCAASGTTVRTAITSDHLLHNTLGTCASGLQTGSDLGAPDALFVSGPPDPDPLDESNPPLYDYSNDFYLEPTPDTDKGLQIRTDDSSECNYDPTSASNPQARVHRWVTDKMTQDFSMTGKVTLEFYTRTLNDALYTGRLCVYLFDRSETGTTDPAATDAFLFNKEDGVPYWFYEPKGIGFWPRNSWTKVRLTMEFQSPPKEILKDHRLGVGLSVEFSHTQAEAIPIMYDHPKYPSRIEVDTTTPIEGG
jgi:hypothetical protein